ncbi:hypothetical protein SAMN05216345_1248 [Cupriavidus sp. YR651]|nr:hypothetical protein SAMN05216345_1248 [Cupriavidus sp. YR651]
MPQFLLRLDASSKQLGRCRHRRCRPPRDSTRFAPHTYRHALRARGEPSCVAQSAGDAMGEGATLTLCRNARNECEREAEPCQGSTCSSQRLSMAPPSSPRRHIRYSLALHLQRPPRKQPVETACEFALRSHPLNRPLVGCGSSFTGAGASKDTRAWWRRRRPFGDLLGEKFQPTASRFCGNCASLRAPMMTLPTVGRCRRQLRAICSTVFPVSTATGPAHRPHGTGAHPGLAEPRRRRFRAGCLWAVAVPGDSFRSATPMSGA